ncbi:hypothetical protein B0J13DRAFT_531191 [Dactylonectria estremocensis]|uniref:Uncharacterized protein n=1 Tax=Dactylonectria estremocensis TaxID=1079267 RepID=A0A9P9DT50_9HYPO|nr:hypothetical protein B0J13DRAFT_531191 [Dactylonectria estremocensis]
MYNNTNTSLTARRFVTDYEVIESIMKNLSATDSSRFMYAVQAKMSDYIRNKYMSPIRDFPELDDWLTKMKQAGFTVTIVGRDLETLRRRIMYPWVDSNPSGDPLRVWMAVIPPLRMTNMPELPLVSAFGRDCIHETGAIIPWVEAMPQMINIEGEPYVEGNNNHSPDPVRCGHGEIGYGILCTGFAVPNDHLTPVTDIERHDPDNENGMIAVFNKKYCTIGNPLAVEIREEKDTFNALEMGSDNDARGHWLVNTNPPPNYAMRKNWGVMYYRENEPDVAEGFRTSSITAYRPEHIFRHEDEEHIIIRLSQPKGTSRSCSARGSLETSNIPGPIHGQLQRVTRFYTPPNYRGGPVFKQAGFCERDQSVDSVLMYIYRMSSVLLRRGSKPGQIVNFSDDFLLSLLSSHQTQLLQPRHLSEQLFDASLLEIDAFADFASREKTMRFEDKLHAASLSQKMLLGTMPLEPPPSPVSTSPERLLVEAHREKEIEILHVFRNFRKIIMKSLPQDVWTRGGCSHDTQFMAGSQCHGP